MVKIIYVALLIIFTVSLFSQLKTIPGDYLFSGTFFHEDDTVGSIYQNPKYRNWDVYGRYNDYNKKKKKWILNQHLDDHILFFGKHYPDSISFFAKEGLVQPFPYKWFVKGKVPLWHHTINYNDTYRAWKYSTGKNTLVIISDPQGFYTEHPDLIDRWDERFIDITPKGGGSHGTVCAGAIAASFSENKETSISPNSSIGVAPETSLIGISPSIKSIKSFFINNPDLKVDALSISYVREERFRKEWEDFIKFLIEEKGVVVVTGRAYGSFAKATIPYSIGHYVDGCIAVGDYRPDYRVNTKYYDDKNQDWNMYAVEINAPGYEIWVPRAQRDRNNRKKTIYSCEMSDNSSISVPQVVGTVSIIKSKYPWMTPAQVERQILNSAHHLEDMIKASKDFVPNTDSKFFGYGCLNVYKSLFLTGDFNQQISFEKELLVQNGFVLKDNKLTIKNGEIFIIDENSEILLENCEIKFKKGSYLIVRKNSKIKLKNSKILINKGCNLITETKSGNPFIQE